MHGGSSESMALREGGMIIEAWLFTSAMPTLSQES